MREHIMKNGTLNKKFFTNEAIVSVKVLQKLSISVWRKTQL